MKMLVQWARDRPPEPLRLAHPWLKWMEHLTTDQGVGRGPPCSDPPRVDRRSSPPPRSCGAGKGGAPPPTRQETAARRPRSSAAPLIPDRSLAEHESCARPSAMSSLAPSCGPLYSPRRPETTVLYRVLGSHLETFIERTEAGDRELPGFVKHELRSFLACGISAHGFARFRCRSCGHSRLVPFSCRGRGFCPSCTARRLADQAAHLVDHVIPHVPVRQWVLSLPLRPARLGGLQVGSTPTRAARVPAGCLRLDSAPGA